MVIRIVIILHLLIRVSLTLLLICLRIMLCILISLSLLPITHINHLISILVNSKAPLLVFQEFTIVNIVFWLPLET